MVQVNSFRKEFFIAVVVFMLPFTPYFHLLFMGYEENSLLQSFSKKHFYIDIDMFIYAIIRSLSFSLLFYIWYVLYSHYNKNFILILFGVSILQLKNHFIKDFIFNNMEITIGFIILFFLLIGYSYSFFIKQKELGLLKKDRVYNWTIPFIILLLISARFSYTLFPNDTDSLRFIFFEIDANGFPDARTHLYFIGFKFCMLGGILLWFFIEKKWYKYALLSGIIVVVNQLYNVVWIESEQLDEFELRESGIFLFSVALVLILISHAAHKQAKIRSFMYKVYNDVERTIVHRFKTRQNYINTKRKEFNNAKNNVEELKKIKEQIEQAIGK